MQEKADVIRANFKSHIATNAWTPQMTLHEQMKWEVDNNVANLNGKNNKKILGKERKNDW